VRILKGTFVGVLVGDFVWKFKGNFGANFMQFKTGSLITG